ncbi:hypothetical protein H5410_042129 [Solanum commersonii]|uniref:Uncharacterized protein n=1 Tax=Solanum commersonii TaxID=4109 RepID=A0A9J5XVI2_SOLCO|nr:hypothetical protein H5410_042129 [Solanum commersonii]
MAHINGLVVAKSFSAFEDLDNEQHLFIDDPMLVDIVKIILVRKFLWRERHKYDLIRVCCPIYVSELFAYTACEKARGLKRSK